MVLPDRIELSTSPLPMECSTTELRQHAREQNRPRRPRQAGGSCHKGLSGASLGTRSRAAKIGKIRLATFLDRSICPFWADRFHIAGAPASVPAAAEASP